MNYACNLSHIKMALFSITYNWIKVKDQLKAFFYSPPNKHLKRHQLQWCNGKVHISNNHLNIHVSDEMSFHNRYCAKKKRWGKIRHIADFFFFFLMKSIFNLISSSVLKWLISTYSTTHKLHPCSPT